MKPSYGKKLAALILALTLICCCILPGAAADPAAQVISVPEIDGIPDGFITGADVSSLLSLERSGRVFYGYDGRRQDLLKTLSESGVNYIRVRVWNDPFDENGCGYGGGNCTVDTAVTLGRRAAQYGMGLLVDFHYSDFWADPGKQQAPKAWQALSFDEKQAAVYRYTADSLSYLRESGVTVGMVQVGNETTMGFCGETEKASRYALMRTASQAVRDTDPSILIAVHFTNPEQQNYAGYAADLQTFGVDYDIFATSFYPEYHGTVENLCQQLKAVCRLSGKKVMIAETSWAYTSDSVGAYKRSVQGQADEIADCIRAMTELGDSAVGVFYWEPAWIDVPGSTEEERVQKREQYGAGWASSYAGSYDPDDAGRYYGATACLLTSLFDPDGHPLPSLKTFLLVRQGTGASPKNYLNNPSFEDGDASWKITQAEPGTVSFPDSSSDAFDGAYALHFWSGSPVDFSVEQTVNDLPGGCYSFSVCADGDGAGEDAVIRIYAVSGGVRYEQRFSLDGWCIRKVPLIARIPYSGGSLTVGAEVKAASGAWGNIDCAELVREPVTVIRGDADGDGSVTVFDATAVQRRLSHIPVSPIDEEAADADGSGLDITDATQIQRYLAFFENVFHIGEIFVRETDE